MKKVTLFIQPNVHGLSLGAAIARLSKELNFELVTLEGRDCTDFRIACVQSHAVIIDLSMEADGINNYNILTDEHPHIDHILIVSRTFLPINVRPARVGGAPPYPFPKESIPGFSWSNRDILQWLNNQLTSLLAVNKKHLVSLEKTHSDFPRAVLESLIKMSKESASNKRKSYQKKNTVFISYRGRYYPEVRELAQRIQKGEWHRDVKPKVTILTPGQLAFESELLTEVRRWQVLGMLEDLINQSIELWIYLSDDYLNSWWTVGELVCTARANYMWETDQRWTPGPKIKVFDPQSNSLLKTVPSRYLLNFNENTRAQLDRMMSIAHHDEIDLAKIKRNRTIAKIYPFFYHLGLGGLFTKPMENLKRKLDLKTLDHMLEEDRDGIAEMQDRYLNYWANPDNLLFQLQNPLFKRKAWNKYSTTYHEGYLDNETGQVDLDKFFDCRARLSAALDIAALKRAHARKVKIDTPSKEPVSIIEHTPRLLWEGANDGDAQIFKVPTFTVE